MSKSYLVAVVGATGAVGQEMIKMLEKRKFPVKSLRLLASERSAGKIIKFHSQDVVVEKLEKPSIPSVDIALFSAGATISKEYGPLFAEKGAYVIDNSSAFRMEKDIPLVVPEVNPHTLSKEKRLIANPNCSTIQMVVVLKPLHDYARIKRIIVATYQSVSGAGGRAIEELESQVRAWANKSTRPEPKKFPYQIAFNLIPQIDIFLDNGYTKEEMKMVNETKKIMELPDIMVSATCVRVPVFRSHSESVWIETEKELRPEKARQILKEAPGVLVYDDIAEKKYPMPIIAEHQMITYVGRIRQDISLAAGHGLALWIVSDNLLKGAALNAVQIAEELLHRKII